MKRITLIIIALIAVFALTGCGSELYGENLVVVHGDTANGFELSADDYGVIADRVHRSFRTTEGYNAKAFVSWVVSDGSPRILNKEFSISANNQQTRDSRIRTVVGDPLFEFLGSDAFAPQFEEIDLLGSIFLASDLIRSKEARSTDENVKRRILVMSPGISSTGSFNMREHDLWSGDTTLVAKKLAEAGLLPDLSGITVEFARFGAFSGHQRVPQAPELRRVLIDTWKNIITLSGGTFIYQEKWQGCVVPIIHYDLSSEVPSGIVAQHNPPFVSTIYIPTPTIPSADFEKNVFLSSELGFIAGASQFRNESEAIIVLNSIAQQATDYLLSNPDRYLYVVGSIARVNPDFPIVNETLSQERADTVRRMILELLYDSQIPNISSRIIAIGTGCEVLPWRQSQERDPNNGNIWVESQAMLNRVVAVISSYDDYNVNAVQRALANITAR